MAGLRVSGAGMAQASETLKPQTVAHLFQTPSSWPLLITTPLSKVEALQAILHWILNAISNFDPRG